MKFSIRYSFETMERYNHQTDEYEYECREYEFYPDRKTLEEAIIEIMMDTYFTFKVWQSFSGEQLDAIESAFRNLNNDNDNWEQLAEDFRDELKERFRDVARDEMEEEE